MNLCPICAGVMRDVFSAKLLGKYQVQFAQCAECDFLRSEAPYWLEEAYASPIAMADTGLVTRNLVLSAKLAALLYLKFDARSAFVDVAGGYGMLARLMRDYGFDFYWSDKFCANLLAMGFEAENSSGPFAACTAFEVLEHVHDPLSFVREQLDRYQCRTMVFTTELFEGSLPPAKDWWYYTFQTGQHISFYNRRSLSKLAQRLELNFYSLHGMHVFTDGKLPLSPFLNIATSSAVSPAIALWARRKLGSRTGADHRMLLDGAAGHTPS